MKKSFECKECGATSEHPFCDGHCGRDLFLIPIVATINIVGNDMPLYFCADCLPKMQAIIDKVSKEVTTAQEALKAIQESTKES